MEPKTSLFTRARPGQPAAKKVRGFLSLPPELRNMIYRYYFESDVRCEIAARGCDFQPRKPKTVKLWAGAFQTSVQMLRYSPNAEESAPNTIRIARLLGKYNVVQGLQTNWFSSLFALNIVCKLIHAETVAFIYQKTVFVFSAPNRIINFHKVISQLKLAFITSLQLHYSNYGCPGLTKDRVWQDKHYASWVRACSTASKKLVNLQRLKIWMRIRDSPLRFNLREPWLLPLLQFRRLTQASKCEEDTSGCSTGIHIVKLADVDIDFRTQVSDYFIAHPQLTKANKDLHHLFGQAIRLAILGAKEVVAMAGFMTAWEGEHALWQHHFRFAGTRF